MEPQDAPQAEGQVADSTPDAAGQATDQGQAESSLWYDSAPDEVKGYIQNKGWDDPIKAVTSYQQLEKFRGASEDQLLKLPKDMSEEGAMDEIYNRLGRPESPDKYELDLGENGVVDKDRFNFYAELAHKAGLSQAQFEQIAKADAEYWQGTYDGFEKDNAAQQELEYAQLMKEWGPNAAEREELSRRGLKASLPKDANVEEIATKIENAIGTAATLKLFANIGEKMGREDKIHDGTGDKPFGYTREQALADKQELVNEIKSDPQRLANYNKGIGNDVAKLQRLSKIIAG